MIPEITRDTILALKELQDSQGWKLLCERLDLVIKDLEDKILEVHQGTSALVYSQDDLMKARRSILKAFIAEPADAIKELIGTIEQSQ